MTSFARLASFMFVVVACSPIVGCATEADESEDSTAGAVVGSPADQRYQDIEGAFARASIAEFTAITLASLGTTGDAAYSASVTMNCSRESKLYRWHSKELKATFVTVHLIDARAKVTTLTGIFDTKGTFVTSQYLDFDNNRYSLRNVDGYLNMLGRCHNPL